MGERVIILPRKERSHFPVFALAFTGKCRAKQSGIKAARRARPPAAPGWTKLLEI